MKGTMRITGSLAAAIALVAAIGMLMLSADSGTAQAQTLYQVAAPNLEARQGAIVVRWSKPLPQDPTIISHYEIQLREQGGEWQTILFYAGSLHHTIWGVSSDTDYDVRVQVVAKGTDLEAPDGIVASIRTLPPPPGSTPTSDSHGPTFAPSTDPPPLSHYDADGEPHGKANFKQCSGGVACNE